MFEFFVFEVRELWDVVEYFVKEVRKGKKLISDDEFINFYFNIVIIFYYFYYYSDSKYNILYWVGYVIYFLGDFFCFDVFKFVEFIGCIFFVM